MNHAPHLLLLEAAPAGEVITVSAVAATSDATSAIRTLYGRQDVAVRMRCMLRLPLSSGRAHCDSRDPPRIAGM